MEDQKRKVELEEVIKMMVGCRLGTLFA